MAVRSSPLLLLLLLAGCAGSPTIRSTPGPDFEITSYSSYHLQPIDEAEGPDPGFLLRNGATIRSGIERAMAQRGLAAADEAEADLLISARVRVTERLANSSGPRIGFGVSSGGYGSGVGTSIGVSSGGSARTESTGTLSIELVERESGELVWVGWAEERVNPSSEQRIGETIDAIMAELPGGPVVARITPADQETQEDLRKRRKLRKLSRH